MNSTGQHNDLDFLNTFWKEANIIADRVVRELPKIDSKVVMIGKYLGIVQYKDLDNWSTKSLFGKSENLSALADKIRNMIYKGDALNVQPMILRIVKKGMKKQSHPPSKYNKGHYDKTAEFLGFGHFRWNFQAYTLQADEITAIKNYFNIQ